MKGAGGAREGLSQNAAQAKRGPKVDGKVGKWADFKRGGPYYWAPVTDQRTRLDWARAVGIGGPKGRGERFGRGERGGGAREGLSQKAARAKRGLKLGVKWGSGQTSTAGAFLLRGSAY